MICFKQSVGCLLLSCLLLTGCGFQLRGYAPMPTAFKTLAVCPDRPYDPFQVALRKQLRAHCIRICSACTPDIPMLRILSAQFDTRAIGYAPNGTTSREQLTLSVEYEILDKNKCCIKKGCFRSMRTLDVNPNDILANDNERTLLKTQLYEQAALGILRLFQTLCCT